MTQGANTSPFVQVGHIVRSQGLKGELKVLFESDDFETINQLQVVYLRNERGDLYPCRIANRRVEGKGNKISFFVQFENIADRSSAEVLKNKAIYVERQVADLLFTETEDPTDLIDFEVLNEQNKSIGYVIDLMDSGAQVVITVATTSGSLLIPLVDEYVIEVDYDAETIRCKNLEILEGL